jgi:hypothetical protein
VSSGISRYQYDFCPGRGRSSASAVLRVWKRPRTAYVFGSRLRIDRLIQDIDDATLMVNFALHIRLMLIRLTPKAGGVRFLVMRRVVVGFSGGVTSAWCAGWALRTYPREEVILMWHDTKEEHPDTYRFIHEMAAALDMPITERSDGRSVTQVFRDEGFLGNNQNSMCSRILKQDQGNLFIRELKDAGYEVVKVVGMSAKEPKRVARQAALALEGGFTLRMPMIETDTTKQEAVDWVLSIGVKPSAMYCWSEHANCVGCVKGGMAYWQAVAKHAPEVFAQRVALEEEFGHGILRGGDREHYPLKDLVNIRLKRQVNFKEQIEIGACECGD